MLFVASRKLQNIGTLLTKTISCRLVTCTGACQECSPGMEHLCPQEICFVESPKNYSLSYLDIETIKARDQGAKKKTEGKLGS